MSKYLETKKGSIESAVLEAMSPAQQAAIAISKKEKGEKPKDEKDEGNAFGAALNAAREKGEKTFTVAGKQYDVKTETNKNDKSDDGDGMDAVQPKAVKKKFADRKDKDIDNDGDVDDSDKFLHKRRKAVSKAINKEEVELDEGYSPKEIKMAIGIASDKRYAGGNYSGAVKAIEKIKKGLSNHKQVAAVLKRQNESLAEKAARHIADMWKKSAEAKEGKVKEDEESPKKKESKTAMTGKPMAGVEVNPKESKAK